MQACMTNSRYRQEGFKVALLEGVTCCRPLIKKPPPFKGLHIRIPMVILIEGRRFINQGSTLVQDHNKLANLDSKP